MDVFNLLHEDHENVSLIFKKIESMKSKETEQNANSCSRNSILN